MTTWRMLGPLNAQWQTANVNGRTYAAAAGQPIDVSDFDAKMLNSNGWIFVAVSGPTSARPANTVDPGHVFEGAKFWDTTLSKFIVFAGGAWRDPATGSVV